MFSSNIWKSPAKENIAKFATNGSVDLYYDNSKKFETASDGILASGAIRTNAATSGLARDMAKLKKDMSASERRRFEAQEQAKKAREDAEKEIKRITGAAEIKGEDKKSFYSI